MDYMGILKKSWNLTWRYKILWLFGFFAGAGGGGGSGSSWNTGSSGNNSGLPGDMSTAQVQAFIERYLFLIIIVTLFFVVLGLLLWIIAVAARGGLIHLVNEAEEGRAVKASAGWHEGFARWGRVFGVGFLADLPVTLLVLLMLLFVFFAAFGAVMASEGSTDAMLAAIVPAATGMCCFLGVFIMAAAVLGVILGIVKELALRYVVLEDRRVMDALKTAWRDLLGKRGSFVMYLVMILVGFAYGLATGVIVLVMVVPAVLMFVANLWAAGLALMVLAVLILLVPTAIYGAFYHAAWTIFFRRMTGMEPVPVKGVPVAYPPAQAPVTYGYPPQVPAPPAPPAPDVGDAAPEPLADASPEPPAEADA